MKKYIMLRDIECTPFNGNRTEYVVTRSKEFRAYSKNISQFITALGCEVLDELWISNCLFVEIPDDLDINKILNHKDVLRVENSSVVEEE